MLPCLALQKTVGGGYFRFYTSSDKRPTLHYHLSRRSKGCEVTGERYTKWLIIFWDSKVVESVSVSLVMVKRTAFQEAALAGWFRCSVWVPRARQSCENKLGCLLVELYWFRGHWFPSSLIPRSGLVSPQSLQDLRGPQGFFDDYFLCYFWRCAHILGIGIFKAASKPMI